MLNAIMIVKDFLQALDTNPNLRWVIIIILLKVIECYWPWKLTGKSVTTQDENGKVTTRYFKLK